MKTRTITKVLIVVLVLFFIGVAGARYGQSGGARYVDTDGDGVCDNIGINGRDDDGDGIPNGQDNDYVPLRDGNGHHGRHL